MLTKISLSFIALLLTGCVAHPNYDIKSSSPAYIEVDGELYCEKTPCQFIPPHYVGMVGCSRGSSLQSVITAFPIDKSKGFVQQKIVRTACDNKSLYFDMDVKGVVQTIPLDK